jgi:hypothetical protein
MRRGGRQKCRPYAIRNLLNRVDLVIHACYLTNIKGVCYEIRHVCPAGLADGFSGD